MPAGVGGESSQAVFVFVFSGRRKVGLCYISSCVTAFNSGLPVTLHSHHSGLLPAELSPSLTRLPPPSVFYLFIYLLWSFSHRPTSSRSLPSAPASVSWRITGWKRSKLSSCSSALSLNQYWLAYFNLFVMTNHKHRWSLRICASNGYLH